jgi:hypothetical protein
MWCLQLLESYFLVAASLVLMAGMVFSADGFPRGSTGYNLLTACVAGIIICSTAGFSLLLGFEVYRSVKFAEAHVLARRVEEEAIEEAVVGRRRRRRPSGTSDAGGGTGARRRSSISAALRRNSSLARRLSVALGGPSATPFPAAEGVEGVGPGGALDGPGGDPSSGAGDADGPWLQRRASNRAVSATVLQRRASLVERLLGVTGGGGGSGSGSGSGGGGGGGGGGGILKTGSLEEAASTRDTPSGSQHIVPPPQCLVGGAPVMPPPPPPPALPRAQRVGDRGVPPPPPPPPPTAERHAPGGPGGGGGVHRGGVNTAAVAATARSLRVLTMAASEQRMTSRATHQTEP